MAATPVSYGMNIISAGLFRGPAIVGSLAGATRIGEVAIRALTAVGVALNMVSDAPLEAGSWKETIADTLRPYRDPAKYPLKDLVIKGLALCAFSTMLFHFAGASWAFGPAPALYNQTLAWLGPIRIDNTLHPALQFLSDRVVPHVAQFIGM